MSSSGDFAAGIYLYEAQKPIPPPPYTVFLYTVYLHSHREEGGGKVEPELNSSQSWVENTLHDWMYLQSISSNKHLPQSPFIGKFF